MGVGWDILISKKYFWSSYANHGETFSGELVDFRRTHFCESKRGAVNKSKQMVTIVVVQ